MIHQGLPQFTQVDPANIEQQLTVLLDDSRRKINQLLTKNTNYTWDNLMQPLETIEDNINKFWSPIGHLMSVKNSNELREAYNRCLPMLSEYSTEMGQNQSLYQAILALKEQDGYEQLLAPQKKVLDNELRDFHLAGVDLPEDKKQRYQEIVKKLSSLTTKFSENVLDATDHWHDHIKDKNELKGLPEHTIKIAEKKAKEKKLEGYLLTLDYPCYSAVMEYADNRALREKIYHANVTRASDQGPDAGRWDNSTIMEEILTLRHELANLLGFKNYAERSLAKKMADSPKQVIDFLNDLAMHAKPQAEKEYEQLRHFAKDQGKLQPWDIAYYSEKQQQTLFDFSQEDLRPYFPENKVLSGLFEIVNKLYGIVVSEVKEDFDRWDNSIRLFKVTDKEGMPRGYFYADLYSRKNKRGGAWMDDYCGRRLYDDGTLQLPIAYLVCNLTEPTTDAPACFTHDEVVTIFHEFGHTLHHLMTQINILGVSGINGVAWDAVELPSQFMENWAWEKEGLALIAEHYQTRESLPETLFNKMTAAKNYQSAMAMMRQLEFSLFDFRLHDEFDPTKGPQIQAVLDNVRSQTSVLPIADYNRFQHSFSHIFAGGYAAGYYSYKWAEVLSSDAFSKFEENGIFDQQTGQSFLQQILEKGGSEEAMALFIAFRGRKPSNDALLRHNGIISS